MKLVLHEVANYEDSEDKGVTPLMREAEEALDLTPV